MQEFSVLFFFETQCICQFISTTAVVKPFHSTRTDTNKRIKRGSRILQGRVSNPSERGTAPPQLF